LSALRTPARGPDGADLSIDIAWFGDRSASKVFVAFSGVHGVEGFFGSAVQTEWIRRSENRRLPRDTAALLVHAVNPYGFAWLRRTNEDNVDLNRNWIDFERPLPTNERYEEIAEDLCPPNWSAKAQAAADARLASWRERNGAGVFMQAVTGGQWRHAEGLFYGGAAPSWSPRVLTDVLKSHLGSAARITIVDFHTGLGPHGYAEPIIHRRREDPGFARTRSWIGAAATSIYGGGSVSAEIYGDGLSPIQALLPKAVIDAVALECGVLPVEKVGAALRADNWLHTHGDPTAPEAAGIKKVSARPLIATRRCGRAWRWARGSQHAEPPWGACPCQWIEITRSGILLRSVRSGPGNARQLRFEYCGDLRGPRFPLTVTFRREVCRATFEQRIRIAMR
jgi:Protein of unknown function (DUF2817)